MYQNANPQLIMIQIFATFVQDYYKATRKERAYLYFHFSSTQAYYFALLNNDQILTLNDSINNFIDSFKKAWPWRKATITLSAITKFVTVA